MKAYDKAVRGSISKGKCSQVTKGQINGNKENCKRTWGEMIALSPFIK